MSNNQELIYSMIKSGVLYSPHIIEAFENIDRKYFVPKSLQEFAYIDKPLPIGNEQTISQPSTVAFMLEKLEPKKGDDILDIGSGSGWTTALLCFIVGKEGNVVGVERVDELVQMGQNNLKKLTLPPNCTIKKATKELGTPGKIYDKILVSASAKDLPKELFEQLKLSGNLVIPIKNSIFKFQKISYDKIKVEEFPGFVFVPLIK